MKRGAGGPETARGGGTGRNPRRTRLSYIEPSPRKKHIIFFRYQAESFVIDGMHVARPALREMMRALPLPALPGSALHKYRTDITHDRISVLG